MIVRHTPKYYHRILRFNEILNKIKNREKVAYSCDYSDQSHFIKEFAGFMTGFGWVALGIAIISLFENRPLKYVLINGGYMIVSFTLMGAILGAWK